MGQSCRYGQTVTWFDEPLQGAALVGAAMRCSGREERRLGAVRGGERGGDVMLVGGGGVVTAAAAAIEVSRCPEWRSLKTSGRRLLWL